MLNDNSPRLLVLIVIGWLLHIGAVVAAPAMWQVNSATNHIYLFGSIHVANKSMYPLHPTVETAFAQSDVLVVEVDEAQANQVNMQKIIMTKGFYSGTESIQDHINNKSLQLLKKQLSITGVPYVTVARMRPGMLMVTLTVAKFMQMGYSPELGFDRYFMRKARGSKPIEQLETAEQQLELLLGFSDDNLLLEQTLVSLDEADQLIPQLITAWSSGNVAQLEKLMITDQIKQYPQFTGLLKQLIDDRNVTMVSTITEMLKQQKTYFIVVGAGHLVGARGIISLLKQKGYSIQRQ